MARWKRPLLSAAVVGVIAATGVAISPASALADIGWVWTTNNAGRAYFASYGEYLYACDVATDGLRAVGQLSYNGVIHEVQDADGNNGGCSQHYINLSIPEGQYVFIRACLRNGASGGLQYCSGWVQGQA